MVVIGQVADKCLRQREAARRLGVSVATGEAAAGALPRARAGRVWYRGIGGRFRTTPWRRWCGVRRWTWCASATRTLVPTFAREKLVEVHGYRLSVETLRKWMVAEGVWRAKARAGSVRVHQSRPRRECVGDLVQIRRFAARLVRGPRSGLHADRVHRRRDLAPAGAGVLRGGDDRGVHGDDPCASGGARATGGVLLGPVRGVPGQQEGQGGAS